MRRGRTTASCSFSSSRWSSAAVRGRGCLTGTFGDSFPVGKLPGTFLSEELERLKGGKGWVAFDCVPCCWLVGIVPPSEDKGSGGGLIGWICDARREDVVGWVGVRARGGVVAFTRGGEGGSPFKSGAMAASTKEGREVFER